MSSTPQEIKAMLKAGIPVAIVPRVRRKPPKKTYYSGEMWADRLRDSSVTSSARRKHPSISRQAVQIALSQARQTMRRRRSRPRQRTQGVANTNQIRDSIKTMLRTIRSQSGYSQVELAKRMGVPPSNIARLESGKLTPSIITIDAFFKACGFELQLNAERRNAGTSGTIGQPAQSAPTPV
jgi:ribosome-binding protein aMBF1 (putative translation factor)